MYIILYVLNIINYLLSFKIFVSSIYLDIYLEKQF